MFIFNKGYLDVLLTLKETDPSGKNPSYRLTAFKNEYFDDVYFIKVMGKSLFKVFVVCYLFGLNKL